MIASGEAGAEAGGVGGPLGMLVGAGLGFAVGGLLTYFRSRQQQQDCGNGPACAESGGKVRTC